jgi:predicted MPP superfamily phosphohydrolase
LPLRKPSRQSVLTTAERLAGVARFLLPLKPDSVRLERVTVRIPDLPPHLDGYTIGALTDLHLGPLVPIDVVQRAAELLAECRPDLVVVTGDVISTPAAADTVDEALAPLCTYNIYGVYGNWDWDPPLRFALHAQTAIRFLQNQGVSPVPGLWVAGVEETLLGRPNIDQAVAGAPDFAVRILLAHEPDYADKVRPDQGIALQISGHSHGGQVRLPFVGPVMLPRSGRKYAAGLNQAAHCQVYTSRGVGVVHIPIRLFCPPEATLITLKGEELG